MDLPADYVPHLIFKHNVHNRPIDLTIPDLTSSKDLFMYLVDLLCKGLVCLYGRAENGKSVLMLDDLTLEQLEVVKQKLACAGISLHIQIKPKENPHTPCCINLPELNAFPETLTDLNVFRLVIVSIQFMYEVRFELFRIV